MNIYPTLLMCDNIEIASIDKYGVHLYERIPEILVPRYLFKPIPNYASREQLYDFIADRLIPPNRVNIKDVLIDLGLEEYSVSKIARITKAALVTDPWWVKYEPEEDYYKDTPRGRFNMQPLPYLLFPDKYPLNPP